MQDPFLRTVANIFVQNRHSRESGNPVFKPFFYKWLKAWIPAFAGMTPLSTAGFGLIMGWLVLAGGTAEAEWLSIQGRPAKINDFVEVPLRDLHPTQPSIGFDRIYYKLGRYAKDRQKIFDEYCEKNGQKGVRNLNHDSVLQDPRSFSCWERVGKDRAAHKTVVIGPDGKLYLTDGHHTFNAFWEVEGGGADLRVIVVVARDYRDYESMDEFWKQMQVENNVWLLDENGREILPSELPKSLGLASFRDDTYRSLLYFTRRIAWNSPGDMSAPDSEFYGDNYPDFPFVEFYWSREIRKTVDLADYDLFTRKGYVKAIRDVGQAIMSVRTIEVGGQIKTAEEMGQFAHFNNRELNRIDRPGTGKLAYMLTYKGSLKK